MANSNQTQDYFNGLIAKAASSDKFLEFLDGMVFAYEKDYGMIQGAVGKDHAANSGIRVVITNYTGGKVTDKASALVPTWVFDQIREVCLRNTGEISLGKGEITETMTAAVRHFGGFRTVVSEAKSGLAAVVTGKETSTILAIGRALKAALFKLNGVTEENQADLSVQAITDVKVPVGTTYSYQQVRVNTSSAGQSGLVPCNTLSIQRRVSGKDASGRETVYKLPWFINISNFNARPKTHSNGTISYDASTVENRKDCSFSLSNDDMFRCVYAIEHFVAQWERANLQHFVEGMNKTRLRREEHFNNVTNN